MTPCVLCGLDFNIDIPEDDEVQIAITGMCAGMGEPPTLLMDISSDSQQTKEAQKSTGIIFMIES